ncbi:MAG: hypothetical protein PHE43_00550 [Candidatus Nanoarchaeia archaeon]|nr:hypothetical protein [Candidatus Nanoarchaeia archaeon]
MTWKDALKPNSQKISLFLIFVIFSFIAVFFGSWTLIMNLPACKFFGMCAPPGFMSVLGDALGAAPAIFIVSYLLAALIVHEEHARKPTKKRIVKKAKTRGKKKKR